MVTESKLLINETPLVILPSLVAVVGFEKAIILQQIQYLIQLPNAGQVLDDGQKYIWNTAKDFTQFFPFWKPETIAKHLRQLETDGLLTSRQPRRFDRTKYYRVNYEGLSSLLTPTSSMYADTQWDVDANDDWSTDADKDSSSQKTSSKTSSVDVYPPAQEKTSFPETNLLIDNGFKTELNETLTWLLNKKGVHKRNLPVAEWLTWFQDLEAERIDLNAFRLFYDFCEQQEWIKNRNVGITPNVMRRELENFKKNRAITGTGQPSIDIKNCTECQGVGFTYYFDETAQKEKAKKCNHSILKQTFCTV
jgi:hypothetical protein